MRRAFGPRTAFEAAFLIAVPVVALAVGLGPYAIVAASAVGYLLILVLEAMLWRTGSKLPTLRAGPASSPQAPKPVEEVAVVTPQPDQPEPEPEP
jgi:membrane protein implicated in regulation of membrane protease activity